MAPIMFTFALITVMNFHFILTALTNSMYRSVVGPKLDKINRNTKLLYAKFKLVTLPLPESAET